MQRTANSLTYAGAGEAARLGPRRRGGVGGGADLGYEVCGVCHWIGARSRGDSAASGSAGVEEGMQESTLSCSGADQVSRVWWEWDSRTTPHRERTVVPLASLPSILPIFLFSQFFFLSIFSQFYMVHRTKN